MIDPALLRTDPERLIRSLRRRGLEIDVSPIIELEEAARKTRQRAEEVRAAQKEAGREIARLQGSDKEAAIARVSALADEFKAL
ncbi:MAG TPA: serine--tRNA ligase, partial [Acidimicrobiia bacterium]|nr:serine--tRNA ligase [Acidimicrobiia bacterium]